MKHIPPDLFKFAIPDGFEDFSSSISRGLIDFYA